MLAKVSFDLGGVFLLFLVKNSMELTKNHGQMTSRKRGKTSVLSIIDIATLTLIPRKSQQFFFFLQEWQYREVLHRLAVSLCSKSPK